MPSRASRAAGSACVAVFFLFIFLLRKLDPFSLSGLLGDVLLHLVIGGGCTGMLEGGSSKAGPASSSSKVPLQLVISRAAAMVLFTSFH